MLYVINVMRFISKVNQFGEFLRHGKKYLETDPIVSNYEAEF